MGKTSQYEMLKTEVLGIHLKFRAWDISLWVSTYNHLFQKMSWIQCWCCNCELFCSGTWPESGISELNYFLSLKDSKLYLFYPKRTLMTSLGGEGHPQPLLLKECKLHESKKEIIQGKKNLCYLAFSWKTLGFGPCSLNKFYNLHYMYYAKHNIRPI